MFEKLMNSYYYGKSGKGDYTPDDLPKNRWQLFLEMLRVRLSALCRLNLIYMLAWLPTLVVVANFFVETINMLELPGFYKQAHTAITAALNSGEGVNDDGSVTLPGEEGQEGTTYSAETIATINEFMALSEDEVLAMQAETFKTDLLMCLLTLIPCIFITGPWTAGVSYVTRNWARDEHAFIWSDCKDAMKENWKGALLLSGITSVIPVLAYLCWQFYGTLSADQWFMVIPQMFTLMAALTWMLAITYAYPMLVTYRMSVGTVIRNSLLLAVGRLPMSVGVRLLHCVPSLLAGLLLMVTGSLYVPLALLAYYVLFGYSLSRFVTASYTNAAFDKFINSRIEGAQVNRGLSEEEEDDWDDEEEEERELKPWENGYTSQNNDQE